MSRYREYLESQRRRAFSNTRSLSSGKTASASLLKEVERAIVVLNKLPSFLDAKRREILEKAAEPIVQSAKAKVKVSKKTHYTYQTAKFIKSKRAPKGLGEKKGTYKPGNLRDSIRILKHGKFKRSSDVFVGPFVSRGTGAGTYGGGSKSVSGFYAHWVEFGSAHADKYPYMRPAFEMMKGISLSIIKKEITERVSQFGKKHEI